MAQLISGQYSLPIPLVSSLQIWGCLILNSSYHWGRGFVIWGHAQMGIVTVVTEKEWVGNLVQNKYYTLTLCFKKSIC